jgi:hypothetical protein
MTTVTVPATSTSTSTEPAEPATWDLGVSTGLIRIAAGVALWRWRSPLIRMAGGSPDDALLRGVFRYFAVRDVTLGVATLAQTRPGGDVRRALTLQGVADTLDGAACGALVASGRLRRVQGIGAVAIAAVSALTEYAAAWQLRPRRR